MEKRIWNILDTLESNGYQAYLVGGYVRDFVLGKENLDIDIATSATPEEMKQLFSEYNLSGDEHFGNVNIDDIQVTTFRKDTYEKSRFPQVIYTCDIREDVQRRDFTMNALYMDKNENIVDLVGGMDDIKHKVIRTVIDPFQSFGEDPLRMIRALRFMKTLGFQIDESVKQAISENKYLLNQISQDRILRELKKGNMEDFMMDDIDLMLKN